MLTDNAVGDTLVSRAVGNTHVSGAGVDTHVSGTHLAPPSWRKLGYSFAYRPGEANHCPGCGRHNWLVGRLMAECAFCGTALILEHIHGYGATQRISRQNVPYGLPMELQAVA